MSGCRWLLAAVAMLGLGCAGARGPTSAQDGSVLWFETYRLGEALAAPVVLRDRDDLRRAIDAPWRLTLEVAPQEGDDTTPIPLTSCADYLAVRERSVWPVMPLDLGVFQSLAMMCVAGDLLLRAVPPQRDHLADLVLDARLPERLPVAVAMMIPPGEWPRIEADPAVRTWADYAGPFVFEATAARSATYRDAFAGVQTITLLARGDFNGDGVGDALLLSREHVEDGTWKATRLFLVTRLGPGEALELLGIFSPS